VNVIYLDQNVVINLAEKSDQDERFARAREAVLKQVETDNAVFPYSEVHFAESAAMSAESQTRIGEFFDRISAGYRFAEGKYIRSEQFKDVLYGRKTSLRARAFVFRDQLSFIENIDRFDRARQAVRSTQLRKVVTYWASLKQEDINEHIRKIEAKTLARMVVQMLEKALRGESPLLGEFDSEYNTIASDLSWSFRDRGDNGDPFLKAIRFMSEHALEVPAIAIECTGLEALAEQYATDNVQRRKVEKSQLDHDSYDLAAIANFVPYCGAGIFDGNAVAIARRAYKKLNIPAPQLFPFREINDFTEYLNSLPVPENEVNPETEASWHGRTLILVCWQKDKLIRRERLNPINDIQREVLPFGGLKVWAPHTTEWSMLLAAIESSIDEAEISQEMIMYGTTISNNSPAVAFQIRVPFGMFDLCRDEIEAAFKANR
jgi:hypothetical protein